MRVITSVSRYPQIARSNPNRVYAMIETGDGVPWNGKETDRGQIWRSDDGGETWRMINADRNAMGRAHYYSRMAVSPENENETYHLTASFSKSVDGGATLVPQFGPTSPGGGGYQVNTFDDVRAVWGLIRP